MRYRFSPQGAESVPPCQRTRSLVDAGAQPSQRMAGRPDEARSQSGGIRSRCGTAARSDCGGRAVLAFGFVYIHPFGDGHGRLHRLLTHHALARHSFNPLEVVFSLSGAIRSPPRSPTTKSITSSPATRKRWQSTTTGHERSCAQELWWNSRSRPKAVLIERALFVDGAPVNRILEFGLHTRAVVVRTAPVAGRVDDGAAFLELRL